MRTLIFSDSHLETDFDEKKYRFLEDIIRKSDRVIINGDFWDGYFITFSQFIESPYRHLFPLLKKKRAIYITGNHDHEDFMDKRASLFSDKQTLQYKLRENNKVFFIEHGHLFIPIHRQEYPILRNMRRPISRTLDLIEYFIVRNLGKKVSMILQGKLNAMIKKSIQGKLQPNHYYIFGHTHLAEFNLKAQFINGGMINHGLGQYLIIENGEITPKEEWYS